MYDKVKLVLYAHFFSEPYNWREVLERITPVSYRADGLGGKGIWRGRWVTVTETYISFEGSLPKSLYGHNLVTLSLKDVERCIMQLSKHLGVPMYLATVEYAEFAHNFIVDNPPILYLRKLRATKNFKERDYEGTKYIEGDKVRLKFYDKMKEAKEKRELPKYNRQKLPPNLLRYEVTFTGERLIEIFGRDIKANELWDKYVFWKLVAEWFGYYESVEKLPNDCWDIDFHAFECAKDFDKWCVCIVNWGQNQYDYIKNVLFKYRGNPQDKDRIVHGYIKKRIKEALEWQQSHLLSFSLMTELTSKIEKYLIYLLEESNDGMSVEEEKQIFSIAS